MLNETFYMIFKHCGFYLQKWSPEVPKETSESLNPAWHHSHRLLFLNIARRCNPKHLSLQKRLRILRPPEVVEDVDSRSTNVQGPCLWHQEQHPEEDKSMTELFSSWSSGSSKWSTSTSELSWPEKSSWISSWFRVGVSSFTVKSRIIMWSFPWLFWFDWGF